MSHDDQTAGRTSRALDPFQRVKYTVGLVMGVDEFDQEQAYFRERGHLHQRGLHGYGTVSGLKVESHGHQVIVGPGLAIDPLGRPVRIRTEQAGDVKTWVAANEQRAGATGPDGCHQLYVLLAYTEADSTGVHTPGLPKRSEEQIHMFSRIDERFDLRFAPQRPSQPDRGAASRFSRLLARLRPVATGEGITPERMAEHVRCLLSDTTPGPDGEITVRLERAEAVLEAAVRVWVTEVRPAVVPGDSPESAAILLARVDFSVDADGAVHSLKVVEEGRPFLLPTQVLQQYLLLHAGGGRDGAPGGGRDGAPGGGGHLPPPAHGQHSAAGGDLAGFFPTPTVTGLRGRPVAANAPANGAVLTWHAGHSQWEARPVPGAAAHGTLQVQPFVTITRIGGAATPAVELWFHLPVDVAAMPGCFELLVFGEPITAMGGSDGQALRRSIPVLDMLAKGPNRLIVTLDLAAARHPHLQFEFHLHGSNRKGGRRLQQAMAESGVSWIGYDGDATVVAFHHYQPVSELVAAGVVEKGRVIRGNLDVAEHAPGIYLLTFPAFEQHEFYMVKGSPIVGAADYQRTFEVVREHDLPGIVVRVPGFDTGFMVEISRIV